ncbi:glycoside hydrolase [Baffinella frigidus]|nr:glycoside hydrolase [Cryptophyta sp. CCMP2293]
MAKLKPPGVGGKDGAKRASVSGKLSTSSVAMLAGALGCVAYLGWFVTLGSSVPGVAAGVAARETPRGMSAEEALANRELVRDMFYHSYDNYMAHAFPRDELRPIACKGHDTHNCHGCMLTFYDALDTLAVLENRTEFRRVVDWLALNGAATFNREVTVSVFETNIRVLGSLISNHLLAEDPDLKLYPGYKGELLTLAVDVGTRLLRAYNTPTGLPFGSVDLSLGPRFGETPVSATARGGTVLLEFILLSKLSGDKKFARAAERATKALWERRSSIGLLGSHVNVETGEWVYFDSGIGGGIDSFFEYLMKAHLLTGKALYLDMFEEGYAAINTHTKHNGWYVDVDMRSGQVMFPYYRSLQSFWPGLQVLYGDLPAAEELFDRFFGIWRQYGFVPEAYNVGTGQPQPGMGQYPLRPELAESAFYLYRATGDAKYRIAGAEMIASLNTHARVQCGYAAIENVTTKELRDHMDSYFIAETVKYLYLLFDDSAWTTPFRDPSKYIFNTEAHLLPLPKPPASEFLLSRSNPPDPSHRIARAAKRGGRTAEEQAARRKRKRDKKKLAKGGDAEL